MEKIIAEEENNRLFIAQKYFVFKMSDILNNAYHIFEEKRIESLQFILQLCIDTYEEMNNSSVGADKLRNAYKGLLRSLSYQLEKHPFHKLEVYRKDFSRLKELITQIKDDDKEKIPNPIELYMSLKSLQKKLEAQHICSQYVSCLQTELCFGEVDTLIEALISDLLYMGYSINFLNEWYKNNLRDHQFYKALEGESLEPYITRLLELDGKQQEYEVIIPYNVKSDSQKEIADQLLKKHFEIKSKEEFGGFTMWCWKEKVYACKKYMAADYYKAISMAKKEFATDKELFAMWQNGSDVIHENIRIGYVSDNKLMDMDQRNVDYTKLISYSDRNRTEQVDAFIELKDLMKNEDVDTLERVLHTLHAAKSYNIQNRFLNFWSALEYSIYPFPKNSIIEKARTIVSESFALFYIKNKMNIFWERLNFVMQKKHADIDHPECKKFIDYCKDEKDFDTKKMVKFLLDNELYQGIINEISFHIVLQREIMELIMLINDPKKLENAIEDYCESIINDLNCIYRLRNQLIHSAKSMDDPLEYISLRLYRYVNSIVATILYYKKRNPRVSIIEILNSLHNTYQVYLADIKKLKKGNISPETAYRIVRPQYLFLE